MGINGRHLDITSAWREHQAVRCRLLLFAGPASKLVYRVGVSPDERRPPKAPGKCSGFADLGEMYLEETTNCGPREKISSLNTCAKSPSIRDVGFLLAAEVWWSGFQYGIMCQDSVVADCSVDMVADDGSTAFPSPPKHS